MRLVPVTVAILLTALTACDYAQRREMKEERTDRLYQEAMRDFGAGRFAAARKGFAKVLASNPGNASARFQLAVLQQQEGDPLGAVCNYTEYLRLAGSSDKAKHAKERLAICRRDLAVALAKELNLTDNSALSVEAEELRERSRKAEGELARVTKDLRDSQARCRVLEGENVRLRRMVASVGEEEKTSRMSLADARALLDEDEGERLTVPDEAKALADDLDRDDAPRGIGSGAAAVPVDDSPSSVLGARRPDAAREGSPRLTDAAKSRRETAAAPAGTPREARPSTYEVAPGDTLRKIALKFYGNKAEWKRIREANKATVPIGGEIRVGQKLILP